MDDQKIKDTFSEHTYELLQVFPANGVLAIWIDDFNGPPKIDLEKIDFLGLAKHTKTVYTRPGPGHSHRQLGKDTENIVVGLSLAEGCFQICNECGNFAGLCKEGDDPIKCLSELPMRYDRRKLMEAIKAERSSDS